MLSKKYRLNRKRINTIYQKGIGRNLGILGIKILKTDYSYPRFAIVIPQKVVKLAVNRNRLRRIIYAELGTILQDKSLPSADYIIRLYKQATELEIKAQIQKIKNV